MKRSLASLRLIPLVALGSCLVVSACSLLLDWSQDEQLCTHDARCEEGYSCLGERCIRDRSVALGLTCGLDVQCQAGLVCGVEPSTCRVPCLSYYASSSPECEAWEYCKLVVYGDSQIVGMCQRSDACVELGSCRHDQIQACVIIRDGVSACAVSCDPNSTGGFSYASTKCP